MTAGPRPFAGTRVGTGAAPTLVFPLTPNIGHACHGHPLVLTMGHVLWPSSQGSTQSSWYLGKWQEWQEQRDGSGEIPLTGSCFVHWTGVTWGNTLAAGRVPAGAAWQGARFLGQTHLCRHGRWISLSPS